MPDPAATPQAVGASYADTSGVEIDWLDGLTVSYGNLWFNLRPSNTEPVLRLNVEGPDTASVVRLRDEVLAQVRETAG